MAKNAKTPSGTKKKRTAHVDDPSKPGTVLNIETNLLMPVRGTMEELADKKHQTRQRVAKINDAFGKDFTKVVDKEHVNRRAANIAFQLRDLDDETLHETLYHLFFYIKDLGLLRRANKQEELFSAGETGPGVAHPDDQSGQTDLEEAIEERANGHANGAEHEEDESSAKARGGQAARQVAETAGERAH